MPSRTSRHLAEHARYLLLKYFLFTSAIVFLHSAFVYGSTGIATGMGRDKRLGNLGLAAYLGVVGLVEPGEPPVD
jgi:hypothetical protein